MPVLKRSPRDYGSGVVDALQGVWRERGESDGLFYLLKAGFGETSQEGGMALEQPTNQAERGCSREKMSGASYGLRAWIEYSFLTDRFENIISIP